MKNLIKSVDVIIVKVYMLESSAFISTIFEYLKKEVKISGISIFQATKGFGATGEHYVSIVDGIWEKPVVMEFFDSEDKIQIALEYLRQYFKAEHIVYWDAKANA